MVIGNKAFYKGQPVALKCARGIAFLIEKIVENGTKVQVVGPAGVRMAVEPSEVLPVR